MRSPTHEELEYSRIGPAMVQVSLKLIQLIEIGQQRACSRIHVTNSM